MEAVIMCIISAPSATIIGLFNRTIKMILTMIFGDELFNMKYFVNHRQQQMQLLQ